MAEDFDIGPLTWVKDEIDHALKSVLENLAAVAANPEDVASLKFSQTHLYQVSGALDMVGLEGCKRFCAEIENLAGKLERKAVAATPELLEILVNAIHTLGNYLQGLLNGSPDMPLRLFPALETMVRAQGESVEESELFFPDTSARAPKDIPTKQLDDAALPSYVAEQRNSFQKSLVRWLKDTSAESLESMRLAIESVQQVQQQPAQRALWWAASAFTDTLSQPAIAENIGVKRLCRRLDQQLKSISEGATRASSNLLRDVLYYVALSDSTTDRISKVKNVFELEHLLPDVGQDSISGEMSESEIQALEQLKTALDALKDIWAEVSEGKAEALDKFMYQLGDIIEPSQQLTHKSATQLFGSIHELATALDLDASKMGEPAIIEVATALTLLEDALQDYGLQNAEAIQRMATQSQRLQDVMGGGPMSDMSGASMFDQLDGDVLLAVAQQVKDALKTVEQALDTYFRNPGEQQVLQAVDKPLQQVIAAFDMLDMPVPTAIAKASSTFVEHFRNLASAPDQSLFELVAESLSMLGFYVEELPRTRPESLTALEQAQARLESGLQQLGLGITAEAATPVFEIDQPEQSLSISIDEIVPESIDEIVPDAMQMAAEQMTVEADIEIPPVQAAVSMASSDNKIDSAFDPELLDIYLTEAEEVLATIAQNLQALRVNATDQEALTEVRRGFHTLKGSGRTVGLVALGEVAWEAEKMLNMIKESQVVPSAGQLGFMEQASAAFAGWAALLRETGSVTLNPEQWQQQAASVESASAAQPPVALAEEVLIDGTRKMSRTLFNIFMSEAEQHMKILNKDLAGLSADNVSPPTDASRRAAHTLASNAGAAGFTPLGELARGLEHWLDAHQGNWTQQTLTLLENVLKSLSEMLGRASQLRTPKPASGLLESLQLATLNAATVEPLTDSQVEVIAEAQVPEEVILPEAEAVPLEPIVEAEAVLLEPIVEAEPEPEEMLEAEPVAEQTALEPAAVPEPLAASIDSKPALTKVDQELLTMFVEEARELVPQVGNELRAWRANPQESDHPDALQRALHTLKGSARMAGQVALGDTVHSMEDRVMRALKTKVSSLDFDDMFVDLDRIGGLLEEAVGGATGGHKEDGAGKPVVASPGRSRDRRAQFLRLRADVLDRLINEAGEISIARSRMQREMQGFKSFSLDLTESVFRLRGHLRELEIEAESQLQSRMSDLQEANETFDPLEFDRFTRLQELTRMMAESVNDVATIQHGLLMNLDETESALQQQNRMNRELQHGLMDVRMVPFSLISERLQRIVRQTARELGKQVEMKIDGEGVEIDRSVLDKIGAPLEHLLRNAVAHGMETPQERAKLGKPALGIVTLKVRQESDEIVLTVTDDGAGINLKRVREKAIENKLFSADQEISEQALLSVIFEPGFSTAATVSQIAGRGVGLDAVRSDITALAGRIDVANIAGQGALFSIYLPVTLSVAQVVMVRAGSRVFALPSVMVEQVQKLKLAPLAQGYEAHHISWAEREYPLHYLGKLIGDTEHEPEEQRYTPLLLLRSGAYRIALHVDEILGNQEVVMKSIGQQLARVPGMIGATVMGDGKIVLLLNPVQLANREVLAVGSVKVNASVPVEIDDTPVVMVVDDSLTMRKVLGRLLEREGYQVITAKDGMDALQLLQETQPAIMLMDIEMPRMDGFELARNVRDDERTKDIPIIMISSRTAEKHRNVATELGVNAFLGKPVQDEELMAQISELLGRAMPLATA